MARDIVMDAIVRKDSAALGQLATELDRSATGVERFDTRMKGATATSKELDARILAMRRSVAQLNDEWVRTGDRTLLGDVSKAEATIRRLERMKLNLEGIQKANMMPERGLLSPASLGVLAGIGLAAGPAIGAAVAGAVTGAVGVGGIIGGIAAASRDARVKAAAQDFGRSVSAEFFLSGQPFVEPVIRSLDTLESSVGSSFGRIFAPLANDVEPLAQGTAGLIDRVADGFARATANAGPFIDVLATELPEIGDAIGDLVADLSESDGALLGWQGTLQAVENTVRGVGNTITWLSDMYGRSHEATRKATGGLSGYTWALTALSPAALPAALILDQTNNTLEESNTATNTARMTTAAYAQVLAVEAREADGAKNALQSLTDATFAQMNAQLSAQNAALAYEMGLLQLRESVKDHGAALDNNTEAGIRNQQMLLNQVARAEATRQANIANNMAVDEANRLYQEQINGLIANAAQLGLNEGAVRALIGQYAQIPPTITTDIITRFHTITDANYWSAYGAHLAMQQVSGRAGGGQVWAGELYRVNELATGQQVEMFRPAVNGTVEPIGGGGGSGSSAEIASAVARAVADQLRGLAVVLDGREVGRVQGLHAYAIAKAG